MRRPEIILLLVSGMLVVLPGQKAHGLDWSMESSVSLKGEYNDNLRLSDKAPGEVWGGTISPAMAWNVSGERTEVRGDAFVGFARYSGREDRLTSTQALVDLVSSSRGDSTVWSVGGGYGRDLTLGDELRETGLVHVQTSRDLWRSKASWNLWLSEIASVELTYDGNVVRYPDAGNDLLDYRVHSGEMTFARRILDRERLQMTAYYTDNRVPSRGDRFTDAGGRVGIRHLVSESLSGSLSGGFFQMTDAGGSRRERNGGWLAEGEMEKRVETATFRGALSRRNRPTGEGSPVRVDRFSFWAGKTLFSAHHVSLAVDVYRSAFFRKDIPHPRRHYSSVETKWEWRVRERWSLGASYRYARQQYESRSQTAESHAVYLMTTYYGAEIGSGR